MPLLQDKHTTIYSTVQEKKLPIQRTGTARVLPADAGKSNSKGDAERQGVRCVFVLQFERERVEDVEHAVVVSADKDLLVH